MSNRDPTVHLQIYGQGITAAALAAQTLEEAFNNALASTSDEQEARREALHGIGPFFHTRLLDVLEPAWRTSTAEDLECVPGTCLGALGL